MSSLTWVWVPSHTDAWVPGYVLSSDANSVTVRLKSGGDVRIPGSVGKLDTIPPNALDEVCNNLVDLESFGEGMILHHIKSRFAKGIIYTFVGTILVAVNPYKSLDIYGTNVMEKTMNTTKRNEQNSPHVFSIASTALHNLRQDAKDQCVLISGESGAGKTEATKKILQYVSTMSSSTASRSGVSVETQILDTNPILESFGNAKTIRNNNSSRFGKYMEINFDRRNNIKGCNVTAYLLEKTRVVKQSANERNYHIFYMLLAGGTREHRQDFFLRPADQFFYLSQGECFEIDRRSDQQEFQELVKAMTSLAIAEDQQRIIFQTLAGILHLGNLKLIASRAVEGGSQMELPVESRRVAVLLGVDPDGLEAAICCRETVTNNEVIRIPVEPAKAIDQRDALAKYMYGKLFDLIVSLVNTSLYRGKLSNNIGVLDIFGFEVFKENSFEQLCINYCNERLQTFFNEIIFEGEMKMYANDGVSCEDISYQDNLGCVRLLDLKGHDMLDEEIMLPKGSDDKFVSKLHQIFDEATTTKSLYYGRNRKHPNEFIIRHFAGDVAYNSANFMEKNKDALAVALVKLMDASKIPFLRQSTTVTPATSKGNKLTLAAKFKLDLDSLMVTLRSTQPHFVRCVKPNELQIPDRFDSMLTLNQLKYSGLFEAIRIRKSGYSVRILHQQFIDRYKGCVPGNTVTKAMLEKPEACCIALMTVLAPKIMLGIDTGKLSSSPWCVGKSRVYLRYPSMKFQLEQLRSSSGGNVVYVIQKVYRGFIARKRLQQVMGAAIQQRDEERLVESSERALMREEDDYAMLQENEVRGDVELQRRITEAKRARWKAERAAQMKEQTDAAVRIQRHFRGRRGKLAGRRYMCEKMLENALSKPSEEVLRKAVAMPKFLGVSSKLIKMYQAHAKTLILGILNESYVANQLSDATACGHVELMRTALELANRSNMNYLTEVTVAKEALRSALHLKSTLQVISEELSRCVTVPKLLCKVDKLRKMVQQATEMGLGGEPVVHEVVTRIQNIRNLIAVRNNIREAVETCSMSAIASALTVRDKHAKIFGQELCAEEVAAVTGIRQMFAYESQMKKEYVSGNWTHDSLMEDDEESAEEVAESINDLSVTTTGGDGMSTDVRLPRFIRETLDQMRNATVMKDLNDAIDKFAMLVPSESKRKAYTRIYKWVVAFASWRYEKSPEEVEAHARQQQALRCSCISSLDTTPSKKNNSYLANRPEGLTSQMSLGYSFGGPQSTASHKSGAKVGDKAMTKSLKGQTRQSAAITTTSTSTGAQHSPGKTTKTKTSALAGQSTASPAVSPTGPVQAKYIPFSQRQSKSQVVAYEALKKGKQLTVNGADELIAQELKDYEEFYEKNKYEARWRC